MIKSFVELLPNSPSAAPPQYLLTTICTFVDVVVRTEHCPFEPGIYLRTRWHDCTTTAVRGPSSRLLSTCSLALHTEDQAQLPEETTGDVIRPKRPHSWDACGVCRCSDVHGSIRNYLHADVSQHGVLISILGRCSAWADVLLPRFMYYAKCAGSAIFERVRR